MDLGKAIKELRKLQNINQEELSNASGITQSNISAIEGGQRPGENTLVRISDALNVSVATLYLFALEQSDFKSDSYDSIFPIVKQLLLFLNK